MLKTTTTDGIRRGVNRLTLNAVLLAVATTTGYAQEATRSVRVSALTGGLAHLSALVVDPAGTSDTRLSAGPTFGLEIQHPSLSFGSIFAGVAASFSTLEHGGNLGAVAGPGSSATTVILATGGLTLQASDWFDNLYPTLRLGGGLKAYMFSAEGTSSYATITADVGVGFRGGTGPIEILGELRFMPSTFDQAKLPLRGLVAQDQQQNDLLFTVGVTIRP
jgi:hypothetical protein